MLRGFFCIRTVSASVSTLSQQAVSSFCCRILFFFFPLLSFASLPLSRTALRNAPGDVFSEKESHSLSEHSNRLKTYENQPGRGAYFRMLCLVGFSEKNIKKPEYLPRLVKKSIRDFISLRCLCLDEDSQSCNEALCSLFFPLPGE